MKKVSIAVCLFMVIVGILCFVGREERITFAESSISGQDGSLIHPAERAMIGVAQEYMTAITNKNLEKIKQVYPVFERASQEELNKMMDGLEKVNSYTLHGIENARFENNMLKGIALYSMDIRKANHIGKTIVPCIAEVEVVKRDGYLVIYKWNQIKATNDMEYFKDVFARLEKAKQKYGVDDLSKWEGLSSGDFIIGGVNAKSIPKALSERMNKIYTIDMTPEQFTEKFNANASSLNNQLLIKNPEISEGEVQNIYQFKLAKNLGLVAAINKKDGTLRDMNILTSLTQDATQDLNLLNSIKTLILTLNPELDANQQEQLLKEIGITGSDIRSWKLNGGVVRGQIKYHAYFLKNNIGFMFSGKSSREK